METARSGGSLDLEEQVFVVPITSSPPQHRADVAVDRLNLAEGHLLMAIGEDAVQVPDEQLGQLPKGWQPLPAERPQPRGQEPARCPFIGVVPEVSELFFKQVRLGEAAVEGQQFLDQPALITFEVGPAAQQQPPLAPEQAAGVPALAEELSSARRVSSTASLACRRTWNLS